MAEPRVMFVVDGGRRLGYGHAGRCLAIWEELAGGVFGASDPDLSEYLRGHQVPVLTEQLSADVVVVDRAAPTEMEEVQRFHGAGSRVALVDDPGPGRAAADLVIDPPTGVDWPPTAGRRLGGFEHALIRSEIRDAAPEPGAQVDILVSLGGSDPTASTPTIVRALHAAGLEAKAVLGPGYSGPPVDERFTIAADGWPRALVSTKLLITRFGHTLLEAAHRGIPAIALTADGRDGGDARVFARQGSAQLGSLDAPAAVADLARALIANADDLDAMASRGRELVDGRGAARAVAAIRELVAG